MQPLLGNLRVSASTGNRRRNPPYPVAFLIFFIYAAKKLADYLIGDDLNGLAYVALPVIVGFSTITVYRWRPIGVLFRLRAVKLKAQASGETAGASLRRVGAD